MEQLMQFAVIAVIMACVWLVMWKVSGADIGSMLLYALALAGFLLFLWFVDCAQSSEVSQWVR
jgi:hypothetical protein